MAKRCRETCSGGRSGGAPEANSIGDGRLCKKAGVFGGGRVCAEEREKVPERDVGAELGGGIGVGGSGGWCAARP